MEGADLVGVIVGFSVLGIFLLIAMYLIITDEFGRHAHYEKLIERDQRKLRDTCGQSSDQVAAILREFDEIESKRGMDKDDEKERMELAEIN